MSPPPTSALSAKVFFLNALRTINRNGHWNRIRSIFQSISNKDKQPLKQNIKLTVVAKLAALFIAVTKKVVSLPAKARKKSTIIMPLVDMVKIMKIP